MGQADGKTDGRTLARFMTLTAYSADRVIKYTGRLHGGVML